MDGVARCISCLRRERRHDHDVVEVEMAGGARKPTLPPELAAWRTLRQVKAGELPAPAAVCAACGQPMFTVEGELPPLAEWVFALPDGPIVVGPDGVARDADDAEADQKIEAHHKPSITPPNGASAIVLASMLAIVALGFGGLISLCDCPGVALTLAAPAGAALAGRARERR